MALDWDELVLAPVMGVFGDAVTYRPRSGTPLVIPDAVFDEQYTFVQRDRDGAEVNTTSPMLGLRASECPSAAQNDLVDIRVHNGRAVNKQYVVKDVRPDNHGHLVLLLGERAAL